MIIVVKIGTSSLTDDAGAIKETAITKLCDEIALVRADGHQVVLVTSAAISAGLPSLGINGARPKDTVMLQAAAAVGQPKLLRSYELALASHGLVSGQILLSPENFFDRRQYLSARSTFEKLLQLGVIPIVNENDAITDAEIRFGDNDRIAALVAHALKADLLLLLTDTAGLYTADPRHDTDASLIEEIVELDQELEAMASGAGSERGSGGMASKLASARIASWSGIRTVIAAATRENVVVDAVAGRPGVGTAVTARKQRLSARKLWIAFAMPPVGRIVVDDGARKALNSGGRSLLAAGVKSVIGEFDTDAGVEIVDLTGEVFAKGVTQYSSERLTRSIGLSTDALDHDLPVEVVHRDDLVVLE